MRRLSTILLLALACSCAARAVAAKTFIVDQAGTGDFTTIQEALNAVDADTGPDTVVVHPGDYAEHLFFPCSSIPPPVGASLLVSSGGAGVTSALDASTGDYLDLVAPYWWVIRGFELKNSFTLSGLHYPHYIPLRWEQCVFRSGVQALNRQCSRQIDFEDCDFYGPTSLMQYNTLAPGFTKLRFHHAPLTTQKYCGTMQYTGCTFEGEPGDTLVNAWTSEDTYFSGCTFDTGALGLKTPPPSGGSVGSCTFRNLGIGIAVAGDKSLYWRWFHSSSNRFEGCGQAIVCRNGSALGSTADTLIDCGPSAIVAGPMSQLSQLHVEGGADPAVDFVSTSTSRQSFVVLNSVFRNVQGVAVRVESAFGAVPVDLTLTSNRFEAGADTAVSVMASTAQVTRNVFLDNAHAGLSLWLTDAGGTDAVSYNTSVQNGGDGLLLFGPIGGLPAGLSVSRNIVAFNLGAGIRNGSFAGGTFASNDAWQNVGGDYIGFAPEGSTLVADPLFCNFVIGDLTVSAGSPCSAYTSTGPIGALGTGCDLDKLDAPPPVANGSFSAWPVPARGRIEFALPARAGAARLDVLDAQGRRVWSASLDRGATRVHWQGERDAGGPAEPGVYWARLVGAGPPQARRFVWLR